MKFKNFMLIRFLLVTFLGVVFPAIFIQGISFAEPGMKIVEPKDGAVVNPGQEITITIESVDGFVIERGVAKMAGSQHNEDVTSLPCSFTDTIPKEAIGKVYISVAGRDASGNVAMDDITLKVQQTATLKSLEIADSLLYETDWNDNIKDAHSCNMGSVYGIYSDGIKRDLTEDPNTTYTSSNPEVISVDSKGNLDVHKIGEAKITVSNSSVSADSPLVFEKPRGIRPKETIPPTAQIDIQPPPNTAGWHNKDITITLTAQDNEGGSGIAEIFYEFPRISAESNSVKSNQVIIPFAGEGVNLFRYGATDKERNDTGQLSLELRIDKTPPSIDISSPADKKEYILGEIIPLTYTLNDNLSGIQKKTITLDAADISNQTSISPNAGSHTLIITASDKADNASEKKLIFSLIKIKADVTIKPEAFLRNKGVFIAIVKLPAEYQSQPIIEATCDGASAKKIITTQKGTILIFRRQDITQQPIDTTFTVTGKLKNNLIFEGKDTIKKIFSLKDIINKRSADIAKDKADEEAELDSAVSGLYSSTQESSDTKKQIRLLND